jgi:hypothetical protein
VKEATSKDIYIAQLIKVIVWSQVLGHLWQVGALMVQDAPDLFARTSVASILVPVLILLTMHLFKIDLFFARVDPGWLFIALGLIISVSMTAMAFRNVQYYFDLPKSLVTPVWHYGQITSIINLLIFLLGFVLTSWCSIRVVRTPRVS